MASTRTIVFGLRDIYDFKVKDTYFIASAPGRAGRSAFSSGFYAGGSGFYPYLAPAGSGAANPSGNALLTSQEVRKIDFNTYTLSTPTNKLTSARNDSAGIVGLPVGKGFFGGGYRYPANFAISTIESVDLSTESTAVESTLRVGRLGAGGATVDSYGYFGGGYSANPFTFQFNSYTSSFERFSFTTNTSQLFSSFLSSKRDGVRGFQTSIYGYFSGGQMTISDGRLSCSIDRLEFFNDVVTLLPQQIPTRRAYHGVTSNEDNGFLIGGGGGSPGVPGGPLNLRTSRVERFDFSNETLSFALNLRSNKELLSSVGDSSYAFAIGGATNWVQRTIPLGAYYEFETTSHIDRFDYNTFTLDTAFPNAPETLQSHGSFSASSPSSSPRSAFGESILTNNSYWINDFTSSYIGGGISSPTPSSKGSSLSRLDFESELIVDFSSSHAKLTLQKSDLIGVSNSRFTYFAGGSKESTNIYGSGFLKTSNLDRIDSTTATVTAGLDLIESRDKLASASSSTYGYFVGGDSGTLKSNVIRLDFSTELSALLPDSRFALPSSSYVFNYSLSPVYSTDYAYFTGGRDRSRTRTSTITRLTFSDNTFSILSSTLSEARDNSLSTMNSYYGYISGGEDSSGTIINTINRIDFTTSTVSTSPFGLQTARTRGCASSSQNYGYFMMGNTPGGDSSNIERLDYSSETISSPVNNFSRSQKSSLSAERGEVKSKSLGSPSRAFIGGGDTPLGKTSTINIFSFSTENITQNSGSLGSGEKSYQAVIGSNSAGYFLGGIDSSIAVTCSIDRFDFTTGSGNSIASTLPTAMSRMTSTSRGEYGYIVGGQTPPSSRLSTISRMDFSTEIITGRTTLSTAKARLSAITNENYGYFGGGYTAPGSGTSVNTIERLDYSTETRTNPGSNLSQSRHSMFAIASNRYGYFAGGINNSLPNPYDTSTTNRIEFLTETITTSPFGPQSLPTYNWANRLADGTSLSTFQSGYLISGSSGSAYPTVANTSTSVRINFATETGTNYFTFINASATSGIENLQRS